MTKESKPVDETRVLGSIIKQLASLAPDQRARVLKYIAERFGGAE